MRTIYFSKNFYSSIKKNVYSIIKTVGATVLGAGRHRFSRLWALECALEWAWHSSCVRVSVALCWNTLALRKKLCQIPIS